jgi:ABC-type transporter Mla subunit MlaD
MKLEKNELRVAVFLVVPLAILLLFIMLKLGYSVAGSTVDVYLKIDSITSIKEGTLVRIKGYDIGRVIDIRPVYKPALHFLAVMRLRRDIDIYEECSAIIQNQNIIGDTVIDIRNPERKGELVGDGSVIEGIEYVNLEAVLQDVHVLLASLTGTVDVLRDISLDSRANLRTLVANLSNSVATVNNILLTSQKDIGAILASFRETAKTMNEISLELKKHPVKFLMK